MVEEKVNKYKDLVKCLRQENQLLLDKVNKVGNKRANLMVRFTKVCRFTQNLKNINSKLLCQNKYWKEECKKQNKKTI